MSWYPILHFNWTRPECRLLPLGHEDFVQAELEWVATTHQVLLDRIPGVPDVQAARLLLLHKAQATANCMFPGLALWRTSACHCLQMIRERHPSVAMECVHQLDGQPTAPVLVAAVECPRAAAALGPPVLHTTTRELQTCTFQGPGDSNTTKIARKDTPRERRKNENCGGRRGKKSAKFSAPHPSGQHPSGPTLQGPTLQGPTLRGATHPSGTYHDTHQIPNWIGPNWIGPNWFWPKLAGPKPRRPKMDWPKLDWPKSVSRGFTVESAAARICREAGGRVKVNVFVRRQ